MADTGFAFNGQRFLRLLLNDLLDWYPKILMITGIAFVFFLFIYVDHSFDSMKDRPLADEPFLIVMFLCCVLFTSVIFNDMHHNLGRYQCLTLPCSVQERYLSKFLLSGPLLFAYCLAAIALFKTTAPVLFDFWGLYSPEFEHIRELDELQEFGKAFGVTSPSLVPIAIMYFSAHILFFLGGIFFRSYALIRTGASLVILIALFFVFGQLAVKTIYFDHFDSFSSMSTNKAIRLGAGFLLFTGPWRLYLCCTSIYLWLAYLSYISLKDHEV